MKKRIKKTDKQISQEAEEKLMNTIAWRCAFYRENPQRFIEEYLHVHLHWFQSIIMWAMFHYNYLIFLASRGIGKTFEIALFCVTRCILYPGTIIVISAKTRKQSAEVLDKIQLILMPASPYLRAEIKEREIVNNGTDGHIVFQNTSVIKTVVSNENARHNRANVVICDEYRMIDPNVINTVIRKFNASPRHPGFMDKQEYKNYPLEPNREIYASSCWYESSWAFKKAQAYCVNMMDPKRDYFICGIPYQVSIMENMVPRKQFEDEMSEADFSDLSFRMESECLWLGSGTDSLYKFEDIDKCRIIKYPWLPDGISQKIQDKRTKIPQKEHQEVRILSCDIALMASTKSDNDAASIFLNSLKPVKYGNSMRCVSNIMYTENLEGMRSDDLALCIRKMFDVFRCDYLVLDARGNGLPIVDMIMGELYDKETGITYSPLGCKNNDELNARCTDHNAPKVIWAMLGSEAFNSQCALNLRESFKSGTVRLLQSDYDCNDALIQLKGYDKLSPENANDFKLPYVHTSLLVNELVNLQVETKVNAIKVHEKVGMRKDRYSSLSYNLYVAKEIEREMIKPKNDMESMEKMIDFRSPKIC